MDHAVTALTRTYLETHTIQQNITITRARATPPPTHEYESVTAEQWQNNCGCKLTKANLFRLYVTKRLLPGDRKYVARMIAGSIVESVTRGEDATFGSIRRTKDAVVGYFQKGLSVYEREAERLGITPNLTHSAYAAPGITRGALILVPETADEVLIEIGTMLGAEVAIAGITGVARSTMWMYNRTRNAGVVVHGVPRVGGYVSEHRRFDLHRKLTSHSLNELVLPVDQKLIAAMKSKGWQIEIVRPGTDDYRYFTKYNIDVSIKYWCA